MLMCVFGYFSMGVVVEIAVAAVSVAVFVQMGMLVNMWLTIVGMFVGVCMLVQVGML